MTRPDAIPRHPMRDLAPKSGEKAIALHRAATVKRIDRGKVVGPMPSAAKGTADQSAVHRPVKAIVERIAALNHRGTVAPIVARRLVTGNEGRKNDAKVIVLRRATARVDQRKAAGLSRLAIVIRRRAKVNADPKDVARVIVPRRVMASADRKSVVRSRRAIAVPNVVRRPVKATADLKVDVRGIVQRRVMVSADRKSDERNGEAKTGERSNSLPIPRNAAPLPERTSR